MQRTKRISNIALILAVLMLVGIGCNAVTTGAAYAPTTGVYNRNAAIVATDTPLQSTPQPTPVMLCVVTNTGGLALNLRSCPGLECPIMSAFMPGDHLTIQATAGTWYQVTTQAGVSGWSNVNYCEVINEKK